MNKYLISIDLIWLQEKILDKLGLVIGVEFNTEENPPVLHKLFIDTFNNFEERIREIERKK